MIAQIVMWLNLVLSVAGQASSADALGVAGGAFAVAVIIAASVIVVLVHAATRTSGMRPGAPHPRRAIDASSLLSQSDPDAPGHPRPRAPQGVAAA